MPLVPLAPFKTPRKAAAARTAQLFNIPAPIGGLNLRDPISMMQPTDALVLNNFIARQQGVELRKGWQTHSATVNYSVSSIFSYNAADPTNDKLFAAANGNIYDVTTSTPSVSQSATGSTDDIWWTCQFDTGADMFLLAVSPTAGYWTYSHATGWIHRTPTNLPSNPRTVMVWKRRVFFTIENSSKVYYLDSVNAITGTAVAFEMGAQLMHGGSISAAFNWTIDAGFSVDDFMVVIGTQGDVMIWEGTDPSTVDAYNLKGIWYVGPVPKYGRYFTPMGGDVMIVSEMGLVPMSRLMSGQFNENQNQTPASKIQAALLPAVKTLRNTKTWDVIPVPGEEILIIKLPVDASGVYTQYAMNVVTGAWSSFTGMTMRCCALLDGQLYFGNYDGTVAKGLYGNKDGVAADGSGGDIIEGDVQTAFETFGSPGINKKFDMARPIFVAPDAPSVKLQLNTQYTFTGVSGSPSFSAISEYEWDAAVWNTARWTGSTNTYQSWVGLQGYGYYGSLRMKVRGLPATIFTSAHVMATMGGMM